MTKMLSVRNISKRYRLGQFSSGSAGQDLMALFRRLRGRSEVVPDFSTDHGNRIGSDLWALRDVSFDVAPGEVIGIIGKNGSGKSTLLKILSRITAPTAGCIEVNGRLASLLEVGTGFHADLTGRENIFLNGTILGMTPKEIRRRFDEIVEFSEISDFIDTPVKRYSSGMFVRLAFAVAAHLETDILVIDEVLAVGDVGFQRKCLGKMSDAAHGGRTVLFVSHRMDHIKTLCQRAIVMNAGRMIYDGDTDSAVQKYYGVFDLDGESETMRRRRPDWRRRVEIVSARVLNQLDEPAAIVATGEKVTFLVRIRNTGALRVDNLKLSIFVYNDSGVHMTDVGSWECGHPPFFVDGEAEVAVVIPRIPFNHGKYNYSCVVRSAGGAFEIDDMIENVGQFYVDYGTLTASGSAAGGVLSIEHSFAIKPVSV